jgi:hypothetical protein
MLLLQSCATLGQFCFHPSLLLPPMTGEHIRKGKKFICAGELCVGLVVCKVALHREAAGIIDSHGVQYPGDPIDKAARPH